MMENSEVRIVITNTGDIVVYIDPLSSSELQKLIRNIGGISKEATVCIFS